MLLPLVNENCIWIFAPCPRSCCCACMILILFPVASHQKYPFWLNIIPACRICKLLMNSVFNLWVSSGWRALEKGKKVYSVQSQMTFACATTLLVRQGHVSLLERVFAKSRLCSDRKCDFVWSLKQRCASWSQHTWSEILIGETKTRAKHGVVL